MIDYDELAEKLEAARFVAQNTSDEDVKECYLNACHPETGQCVNLVMRLSVPFKLQVVDYKSSALIDSTLHDVINNAYDEKTVADYEKMRVDALKKMREHLEDAAEMCRIMEDTAETLQDAAYWLAKLDTYRSEATALRESQFFLRLAEAGLSLKTIVHYLDKEDTAGIRDCVRLAEKLNFDIVKTEEERKNGRKGEGRLGQEILERLGRKSQYAARA